MREVLFRGTTVLTKEWLEGYGVFKDEQATCWLLLDNYGKAIRVIEASVGQFTGLLDKNGKKVFEGDLVTCLFKATDRYLGNSNTKQATFLCEVRFEDGSFRLFNLQKGKAWKAWHSKLLSDVRVSELEVVGNVWDNAEMVEQIP